MKIIEDSYWFLWGWGGHGFSLGLWLIFMCPLKLCLLDPNIAQRRTQGWGAGTGPEAHSCLAMRRYLLPRPQLSPLAWMEPLPRTPQEALG